MLKDNRCVVGLEDKVWGTPKSVRLASAAADEQLQIEQKPHMHTQVAHTHSPVMDEGVAACTLDTDLSAAAAAAAASIAAAQVGQRRLLLLILHDTQQHQQAGATHSHSQLPAEPLHTSERCCYS
jgi:hypothetical protein